MIEPNRFNHSDIALAAVQYAFHQARYLVEGHGDPRRASRSQGVGIVVGAARKPPWIC